MMCQFLAPKPKANLINTQQASVSLGHIAEATMSLNAPKVAAHLEKNNIFTGYLSDLSDDLPQLEDEVNVIVIDSDDEDHAPTYDQIPSGSTGIPPIFHIQKPPPLKRRRLDVPSRVVHQKAQEEHHTILQCGLLDIKKVIASMKMKFVSGREGIQASFHGCQEWSERDRCIRVGSRSTGFCLKMGRVACQAVGLKVVKCAGFTQIIQRVPHQILFSFQ